MDRTITHPELSIVPDAVRRIAQHVDDLSRESAALVANTELFTADQASHPGVADALRRFIGEWNRQVRNSSSHFTDLASRLAEITQSYQDIDNEIADELASPSLPDSLS